jgi:hypothetical protein
VLLFNCSFAYEYDYGVMMGEWLYGTRLGLGFGLALGMDGWLGLLISCTFSSSSSDLGIYPPVLSASCLAWWEADA